MVVPVTGGFGTLKNLQFVEETAFGSIPTASPTFNWVGGIAPINPQIDMDGQDIKIVAYEDPQGVLVGNIKYALDITVYPQASAFLKYGINAQGGGSGSIDKSLTLMWSLNLSGTENFYFASGCRIDSLKLKGQTGKPLTADVSIKFDNISGPTASNPLTTPTYASNPGTPFWNFKDGGSSNITIGGTWYDTQQIEMDVGRNLKEVYTMQQANAQYIVPTNRMVTGTITNVHEVSTNITSLENLTEATLAWSLKSGTSSVTISNVSFRKLSSLEIKPDDVVFERFAFEGRGVTIS